MADTRNSSGVPRTYKRHSWSRIIDSMVGSSVANNDLLLRASGLWTRKAPGSNGQYLKVVSGAPDWATTTGGDGGVGFVAGAYQAADLNINNATTGTTYVNTDLVFSLPVGVHRYEIQAFVFAHQTPDMKTRLHFITGTATDVGYFFTAIIEGSTNYFNGSGAAFEIDHILTTTNRHVLTFRGVCNITVAGTLSFQVAQNSASATQISMNRGSSGIIWQIA